MSGKCEVKDVKDDIDPRMFDKFKESDIQLFKEMRDICRKLRNKVKLPPAVELK